MYHSVDRIAHSFVTSVTEQWLKPETYFSTFQHSKAVGAVRGNFGGEGLEGCDC